MGYTRTGLERSCLRSDRGGVKTVPEGGGDPKDVRVRRGCRGTCAPFLMFFTSVFWGFCFPNRTPSEGWYDGGQAIEYTINFQVGTKL